MMSSNLVAATRIFDSHRWGPGLMEAANLGAFMAEPAASSNLGTPTWVYGSESPNLFATSVAKYFYNSLREEGLVSVANGGIVFGKGDAGTVQEVFSKCHLELLSE
jgi:predicted Rossmann-fold nucleotide-binding protein